MENPDPARPPRVLLEASSPTALPSLLASLRDGGCAVLHADAASRLPDREGVAALLRGLPAPMPAAWTERLLRDWPPAMPGLHPIELEPGRAWLLLACDLGRRSRGQLARALAAWRDAPARVAPARDVPSLSNAAPREAIVVGGGIAGCAMADALARRGFRVVVIEQAERAGGVVAGIPLLAQHPALSPGADRRSRLLVAALLASTRLAGRMDGAIAIGGRFQAMPAIEARARAHGRPPGLVEAVERSHAGLHGIAGQAGLWFPGSATVDPAAWWQAVARRPEVTLQLATRVADIRRDGERWHAVDEHGRTIAQAPVLVLANQAQAFPLARMDAEASGPLRRRPLQVLVGTPHPPGGSPAAEAGQDRAAPVLGIDGYRIEWPGRACVIGPVPEGASAADCEALVATWRARLGAERDAWSWRLSAPAQRLLLRDNLPMAGAAPDLAAIRADRDRLARNDRLELPRQEGLYLLTGLGGRGLLWSVLGAEIVAASAAGEPPVVEPELAEAVDPARFMRRSLRRTPPARVSGVPAQ